MDSIITLAYSLVVQTSRAILGVPLKSFMLPQKW